MGTPRAGRRPPRRSGSVTAAPGARRGTWARLGDDVLLSWATSRVQQTLRVAQDGTTLAAGESRWAKAN